jgi:hypothetical protein
MMIFYLFSKCSYIYELWASLRNDTADKQENHRQFGLTLLDSYYRLTRDKNEKWSQETTQKNGATPKSHMSRDILIEK